jgi:hypothetical protein
MSENKGQRKWPIPAGFVWSHVLDVYAHEDGRVWDPDDNTIHASHGDYLKGRAQPTGQVQQSETVEQQIQRLRATAPRVTPADVQAAIKSVYFFQASDGVLRTVDASPPHEDFEALRLTTFCAIVMQNGFTIYGKSACASPENFREDIGRRVAREDAERQIWPLLGFELRQRIKACQDAGVPLVG